MKIELSFGTSENPNMYQYITDNTQQKYQIQDILIYGNANFEGKDGGIGGEIVTVRFNEKIPYSFLNDTNLEPVFIGENRTEYNKKRFEARLKINQHEIILQNCASYTPEHLSFNSFSASGITMSSMLPNIAMNGTEDLIRFADDVISNIEPALGYTWGRKTTISELFKFAMYIYSVPFSKIDVSISKDIELGEWVKLSGISLMKAVISTIRQYNYIVSTSSVNGVAKYRLLHYDDFEKLFGKHEFDYNKMLDYDNLSILEKQKQMPISSLNPVFNTSALSTAARIATRAFNQTAVSLDTYKINQAFFGFNENNTNGNTIYITNGGDLINISNEREKMRSVIRNGLVEGYQIDATITDPSAPYYKAGSIINIKNYEFAYSKVAEDKFQIAISKFIVSTNEMQISSGSFVQKLKLSPFIPEVTKV